MGNETETFFKIFCRLRNEMATETGYHLEAVINATEKEHFASLTKRIAELEAQIEGRWTRTINRLPSIGEEVLWKAKRVWRGKTDIIYFSDKLTGDEEHIEYGQYAQLLESHSDFYVCTTQEGEDLAQSELAFEWMPIPTLKKKGQSE